MRNAYKFFVGKPERKRPLRWTRRSWEDKLILRAHNFEEGGWIQLTHYRAQWLSLVNTVMSLWFRKRREISWVGGWLLASQEVSSCLELVLTFGLNERCNLFLLHIHRKVLWHVDPLPSNSCVNRLHYNSRC
jgi:hypothetical protein